MIGTCQTSLHPVPVKMKRGGDWSDIPLTTFLKSEQIKDSAGLIYFFKS